MKALILSFSEPQEQGRVNIIGAPRPPPIKNIYLLFLRPWRPSEVDEIKTECFLSNLPISGFQKSLTYD